MPPSRWRRAGHLVLLVLGGVALLAAVVVRVTSGADLWLDEAQTVAIARLPPDQLLDALREDGSPPLYYLALHGWMQLFGTSDAAVRSLSGVAAVASLPLALVAARRLGGPRAAWPAVALLGASPFAVRYATETRPYAWAGLELLLGVLAVAAVVETGRRLAVAALALVVAALLLTHYWAVPVVAVLGLAALGGLPTRHRATAARVLVALAAGGVLTLPWVPSLLVQLRTTGSPWSEPEGLVPLGNTVDYWTGSGTSAGALLLYLVAGLAVLGLVAGRPARDGRGGLSPATLAPSGTPVGRALLGASLGSLALGLVLADLSGGAYRPRYSVPMLSAFLLLAALGVAALPGRRHRVAAVALVVVLGAAATVPVLGQERTSAGLVAGVLREQVRPGDAVVACPDQVGPSVARLAPSTDVRAYPGLGPADRVVWTDYAGRNAAADPVTDAAALSASTAGRPVWLVYLPGYLTYDGACETLREELAARRPETLLVGPVDPGPGLVRLEFESPLLLRFDPRTTGR